MPPAQLETLGEDTEEQESPVEPEDDTSGGDTIAEPFDPTKIRVESKPMSIDGLLARIRHGEIELHPGFQRDEVWNDIARSRLIESILIRIPLPAFYMDATDDEKWLVVDGLQRLSTLRRFVIDKDLTLRGLEFLKQLHRKKYDELPRNFQRRILDSQVTVYLIEQGTPPEVKFNVFRRINTGGLPLSAQEIRHALHQGQATDLLQRLAKSSEFLRATSHGIDDRRMAARECILRFFAFVLAPYTSYKAREFDEFLSQRMDDLNKLSLSDLCRLESRFLRAMKAAHGILGPNAFRKCYRDYQRRLPVNKALFEAWSVNLDLLEDGQLEFLTLRRDDLHRRFLDLMATPVFEAAVSLGTGDPAKVRLRFSGVEQIIRETLA